MSFNSWQQIPTICKLTYELLTARERSDWAGDSSDCQTDGITVNVDDELP